MQCEMCGFDLKQLTCSHKTCTKCLEMLFNLEDVVRSENWCPHCETDDFEKLGSMLEMKMNSVFKGVEHKKKELRAAAETREQIIEEVVHIRCSVESVLRQKELQVMATLDEAYEQLKTMASGDISKGEEELEAISRCWKVLPKMSSPKADLSEFTFNRSIQCLEDITSLNQDSLSEHYRLKLEPDDRFWHALNKLLVLPMGQASLVNASEESSYASPCLDQAQEPPLDITSELFPGFDSDKLAVKSRNSSGKSFFLSVDTDDYARSPFSISDIEKCRISSDAASTPLSPPTSDSGLSSVFTFSGLENVSETAGDPLLPCKFRRRSKYHSPDSPITASKFIRSASAKIRKFLHNLRRSNMKRERVSGKKIHNNQTPCQNPIDLLCSPHNSGSNDSRVVRRKKLFQADESERFSPVVRLGRSLTPTMTCAQLGSPRLPNPDTDFNLPEISMASFSDLPTKLIEFSSLIDDEQSCWLIDIAFLPDEKHVVVFDAINQNLKKFETLTGKLSSVLRLSSEKSNLAVLSSHCLAVTLPEAKQIGYVNYLDQLSVSRKTSTSKVYMGITALAEDRLVCASNSLGSSIDVLSLNCEILASFSKGNLYDEAPLFPTYLATTPEGNILISDRIKRGLLCLNVVDCRVDFSYYGREDLTVTWPAGVACDRQGNIYLADCFKTKMHRLSPTGEFERLYMSEADNVQMCRSVDISSNGKLILTEYRSHNIKVFNL